MVTEVNKGEGQARRGVTQRVDVCRDHRELDLKLELYTMEAIC